MPIGYANPRRYPLPVEQFPLPDTAEGRLMKHQTDTARQQWGALGMLPKGLLDRVPYTQFQDALPNAGLLQPVMWDRVRKQFGLLSPYGTEGGGRGMAGGGGRGTSVPTAGSRPPFVDWSRSSESGMYETRTPAGVRVTARPRYERGGREGVDVEFDMPTTTFSGRKGEYAKGPEGMSIKRGITHMSEAFRATMEFAKKFNPDQIAFSGEGKRAVIYEKLAPDLAKALGGELRTYGKGKIKEFRIDLPAETVK